MQMRKKVQSCLLAALVLVLASPARGDDSATEQAKQHYETGSKQYDLGHWDDAIREYETAYELRPDPSFLYNLAQAYRRKGDIKRALDLYRNYLVKTPKSPLRAEIEERIKSLQKQIDEAASAKPALPGLEPPAAVLPTSPPVDATPAVAPATSSPPADSGPALAAQPATTSVLPPAPQATQAAPATAGTTSGPTVADAVPPAARGRGLRVAGVVTGTVGVAAVVAGAVFGLEAYLLSRKVSNASQFKPSDDSAGSRDARLQWGLYLGGAVAIAAGATLYYLGVRAARTAPSGLSLSPVLGPGSAGVSAMGVF
jgi:tetratricopeptide (TPR) repeat protein